jgi:hypothetical protein
MIIGDRNNPLERPNNPEVAGSNPAPATTLISTTYAKITPKGPITRSLAPHIGGIYDHYFKRDGFCLSVYQEAKELKPQHNHLLQPVSQQVPGFYGITLSGCISGEDRPHHFKGVCVSFRLNSDHS